VSADAPLRAVLERAHAFRTLARAFAPPGDGARGDADLAAWAQRAAGPLRRSLEEARRLAARSEGLGDEHERLFGGRGGGVPARETSYADARRIAPTDLADVAGFLEAFGVSAAGAPPDHVGTELELASLLLLKEAYARAEGWPDRAELARRAYEQLLAAHLARWLPRFAERVREAAPGSFYAAVAEALALLVGEEAARVGVPAAGDCPPHASASADDEPFDCAGACPQGAAGRCG
jgi:TorA maturation chaperone TorD